jgi:hypothetical protein
VVGLGILRPAANKLYRMTQEAPDGPITPKIVAQLKQPLPAIAGSSTGLLFVVIIYLMVARPNW